MCEHLPARTTERPVFVCIIFCKLLGPVSIVSAKGRGLTTLPLQQASLRLCLEEPQFPLIPSKVKCQAHP